MCVIDGTVQRFQSVLMNRAAILKSQLCVTEVPPTLQAEITTLFGLLGRCSHSEDPAYTFVPQFADVLTEILWQTFGTETKSYLLKSKITLNYFCNICHIPVG